MVKSSNVGLESRTWYNRFYWALPLAFGSLLAAYLIGSRALDTGSLQQYGMTFVLIILGLNRLGRAAKSLRPGTKPR